MKNVQKRAVAEVYPQPAKTLPQPAPRPVWMLTDAELAEMIHDHVIEAICEYETNKAPAPDLVDAREMCRRVGISRTSLHRLRIAGMPAIPVLDSFRYCPADVVAWLKSRDVK